jgi:geranylgeranyl transferase type-2 subunit beta
MDPDPYLSRLTSRLADGLARLPADFRERHANYLRAAQNADGGFSGREGDSDLYYTGFALRGLAVLDALSPAVSERAAGYLRANLNAQASVVDFFSFLYSCLLVQTGGGPDILTDAPADWPERVASILETFHTSDGGYNKSPGAASGSTYHTFLVGLCYQLLNRSLPRPADIARFVLSRRRDDGAFVEVAPMRRSGTNPTAAAIGLLQLIQPEGDALTPDIRTTAAEFLAEMAGDDGGLRANGRIPVSDLLSTFTGVWTLEQLNARPLVDARRVRRFAQELTGKQGGFHAFFADDGCDVEYTFYGLGVLALFPPE